MPYRSLPNAWSAKIPLLRPLLGVWRETVWEYLNQQGLKPSLDPSNLDARIYRNRLRHELIPYLETFNPRLRQSFWRTADILRQEHEILQVRLLEAGPNLGGLVGTFEIGGGRIGLVWRFRSSPFPRGWVVRELLNQSHTSKSMMLVSLMNPKFAKAIAARCVRTSGSGH